VVKRRGKHYGEWCSPSRAGVPGRPERDERTTPREAPTPNSATPVRGPDPDVNGDLVAVGLDRLNRARAELTETEALRTDGSSPGWFRDVTRGFSDRESPVTEAYGVRREAG
jgi:hypothetical protein